MVHAVSEYARKIQIGEVANSPSSYDISSSDNSTLDRSSRGHRAARQDERALLSEHNSRGRIAYARGEEAAKIREFEKCLRTGTQTPSAELLIRTSGETRLSNFMLWQSSSASLLFLRTLWPALSYLHLLYAILRYQKAKAFLPT